MFFILSKILSFIISPLFIIVVLMISAMLLKNSKIKKWLSACALTLVLLFSNQLIFRLAVKNLEASPVSSATITDTVEFAVVLGGNSSWYEPAQRIRFHQSSDRLWQGVALLKEEKCKKLFFTGGTAEITQSRRKEADYVAGYIDKIGIGDTLFITENQSKNTHENALNSKKIFDTNGYHTKIILVTSAFHMKRAKACFEKQGFEVIPFPADPLTDGYDLKIHEYIIPSASVLMGWEIVLKEQIGYFVYKIKSFV